MFKVERQPKLPRGKLGRTFTFSEDLHNYGIAEDNACLQFATQTHFYTLLIDKVAFYQWAKHVIPERLK